MQAATYCFLEVPYTASNYVPRQPCTCKMQALALRTQGLDSTQHLKQEYILLQNDISLLILVIPQPNQDDVSL